MDLLGALADDATEAVAFAHEEARALNHNHVGPEHILVGLARQKTDAAEALRSVGVGEAALRDRLAATFGRSDAPNEHVFFIPRARLVVEFAIDEARKRGSDRASAGHLLLGILRDGGSGAGMMLRTLDVTPEALRERLLSRLAGDERSAS